MAAMRKADKSAGAYAQEALSEWGKAVRFGARAVVAKRRERANDRTPLKERLNPSKTDKGGRVGDVVDLALSKFGAPGKLASKVSLGSRMVERVRGNGGGTGNSGGGGSDRSDAADANGLAGNGPIPIQQSIDVAVPVRTAFDLCTRFGE